MPGFSGDSEEQGKEGLQHVQPLPAYDEDELQGCQIFSELQCLSSSKFVRRKSREETKIEKYLFDKEKYC